jgi:ribose transport system substrate-binding protein
VVRALAVVCLCAAAALPACGRRTESKFLVGFSQCNLGEPWRVAMNADVAARAKDFPQMEIVFADAQQDNAKQVADVENFLRQGINLLMISPNEAKPLTAVVRTAYERGIPVIVIDRAVEGDAYTAFIGADNRLIGREAGKLIGEILGGTGNIVEIKGLPGSPPARDRSEGMREALAVFPGIRIVHEPVANWLREEAMTQMEIALAAHDRIDLVYAHNDPMAVGAYLAAAAKHREHEMKFIGIDALPGPEGGRQAVADGRLQATFVYPTGGREAVEMAAKLLAGEQVPRQITLDTERITRVTGK